MQNDESLRKWKEQLLGSLDLNSVGGNQPFSSFILIIFRHFGLFWDLSISFYSFFVQIFVCVCVCEKWPFPVCSGDLFRACLIGRIYWNPENSCWENLKFLN